MSLQPSLPTLLAKENCKIYSTLTTHGLLETRSFHSLFTPLTIFTFLYFFPNLYMVSSWYHQWGMRGTTTEIHWIAKWWRDEMRRTFTTAGSSAFERRRRANLYRWFYKKNFNIKSQATMRFMITNQSSMHAQATTVTDTKGFLSVVTI